MRPAAFHDRQQRMQRHQAAELAARRRDYYPGRYYGGGQVTRVRRPVDPKRDAIVTGMFCLVGLALSVLAMWPR